MIIGISEDDGLKGVDGLLITDCCLDVDGCRLASPSVELQYFEKGFQYLKMRFQKLGKRIGVFPLRQLLIF